MLLRILHSLQELSWMIELHFLKNLPLFAKSYELILLKLLNYRELGSTVRLCSLTDFGVPIVESLGDSAPC